MGLFRTRQEKLNDRLKAAAMNGEAAKVAQLLARGADINCRDRDGYGIMTYAMHSQDIETVKLLFAKNPDLINVAGDDGRAPMHMLCTYDGAAATAVAEFLLATDRLDLTARDKDGQTFLHTAAAWNNDGAIMKLLLDAKMDPNATDKNGNTPLHSAAYDRYFNVTTLVEYGANAKIHNHAGKLAEDYTKRRDIAYFLRQITAPAPGWHLTAKDEISLVAKKEALGYSITSIFNFGAGTYTQISRNLETKVESQAVRFFSEIRDKKLLEDAYKQFLKHDGKPENARKQPPFTSRRKAG